MDVWFLTITSKQKGYSVTSIFGHNFSDALYDAENYICATYNVVRLDGIGSQVIADNSAIITSGNGEMFASLLPDIER